MLNRRTTWLLAVVMTLGCAYVLPGACGGRGAEVGAIACRAEQGCEQQQKIYESLEILEGAPAPVLLHAQTLRAQRFTWPASYERPPTQTL
jgi:hypothetical protein